MRNLAQNQCCTENGGSSNNGPVTPAQPDPNYVYPGPFGNEPTCQICGTAEYPGKPFEFIIARYVGEYSCAQLYYRGLNGLIDETLCGPLQDFAQSVCGCGRFNPACDPSKPPSQTFCFGTSPTPAPTSSGVTLDLSSFTAEDFQAFQAFLDYLAGVNFDDVVAGCFNGNRRRNRKRNRALRGVSETDGVPPPPTAIKTVQAESPNAPEMQFSTRSSSSSHEEELLR